MNLKKKTMILKINTPHRVNHLDLKHLEAGFLVQIDHGAVKAEDPTASLVLLAKHLRKEGQSKLPPRNKPSQSPSMKSVQSPREMRQRTSLGVTSPGATRSTLKTPTSKAQEVPRGLERKKETTSEGEETQSKRSMKMKKDAASKTVMTKETEEAAGNKTNEDKMMC